jgi:hypothetical protein
LTINYQFFQQEEGVGDEGAEGGGVGGGGGGGMWLLVGAFLMVAVKNAVVLVAVGGVLVLVLVAVTWNCVWERRGLLGFVRGYPDADLRGAIDEQYVKVTGVISLSAPFFVGNPVVILDVVMDVHM